MVVRGKMALFVVCQPDDRPGHAGTAAGLASRNCFQNRMIHRLRPGVDVQSGRALSGMSDQSLAILMQGKLRQRMVTGTQTGPSQPWRTGLSLHTAAAGSRPFGSTATWIVAKRQQRRRARRLAPNSTSAAPSQTALVGSAGPALRPALQPRRSMRLPPSAFGSGAGRAQPSWTAI